jgi:hypothetical protein
LVAGHLLKWTHYEQDAKGRDVELRYFRDTDASDDHRSSEHGEHERQDAMEPYVRNACQRTTADDRSDNNSDDGPGD